jgi:adenylate cyclase
MSINRKRRWRIIRNFGMGWAGAFVFLAIVRGSGTIEEGSTELGLLQSLAMSVLLGSIFGGLAGVAQVLIEERAYKRMPLHRLLTLRLLFAIASLFSLVLLAYLIMTTFFGVTVGVVEFFIEPGSFAIYFYVLSADLLLVGLRQVDLLLGDGNLWRLLRGRFYTPREDEKIFMFLDLGSSTTHAEALGHITYSELIQDCFDDLGVVAETEAQVYQYLGDGVVLTWSLEDGLKDQNCIWAFLRFRERIDSRGPYYQEKYQRRPRFTAGLHMGKVVVTEVGRHKKEIAYHGDTINTAARIQGQCKPLSADLLISRTLAETLGVCDLPLQDLGDVRLPGKERSLGLVSVEIQDFSSPRGETT